MSEASFNVEVTEASAREFATVSGDWNPLHTDPSHAARTAFRRPILHGAFSAGLISRLAGMHLPARLAFCTECASASSHPSCRPHRSSFVGAS